LWVIRGACQAEIGDLGALEAFIQQDVGRLDIAVDQSLRMSRRQPGSNLAADANDFLAHPTNAYFVLWRA
jgi:hypothetical protein